MTTDFQKESLSFAQKCFDDVRAMSKDTTGVSRQGYGPVETKVLEYFKKIGEELKHALERTPPQIHDHIQKEGIYITGGSTRIPNIDRYLSRQLGCPVQLSQYYDLCTICGLKELITHDALHRWAYTVNKKK